MSDDDFREFHARQKAKPKNHHKRNANGRAIRQSLDAINPENSDSQEQSPLFSVLPSEIRNIIFGYVVSECYDYSRPVDIDWRYYRPGHEYHTRIDTALLRTCRLIYYETRAIPMQSATHHFHLPPSWRLVRDYWFQNTDDYLFHLSSQQGQNLYHLHVIVSEISGSSIIDARLLPHLHWRKITLTAQVIKSPTHLSARLEPPRTLLNLSLLCFPNTCREVNLEIEKREDLSDVEARWSEDLSEFRAMELTRRNGSPLRIDDGYCFEYMWEGTRVELISFQHQEYVHVPTTYRVRRLCWRDKVPERDYMRYDHLDCLRSNKMKIVRPEEAST